MLVIFRNQEHNFETTYAWDFVGYFFLINIPSAGRNLAVARAALMPLPERKHRFIFFVFVGRQLFLYEVVE